MTTQTATDVTAEIDAQIRTISLLVGVYAEAEPGLEPEHAASYTHGFKAGARAAYADCVGRLQELKQAVT